MKSLTRLTGAAAVLMLLAGMLLPGSANAATVSKTQNSCVEDSSSSVRICISFDFLQKLCSAGEDYCADITDSYVTFTDLVGAEASLSSGSLTQGAAGNDFTSKKGVEETHKFPTISEPISKHTYHYPGAWAGHYIGMNVKYEEFQGGNATLTWYHHGTKAVLNLNSFHIRPTN